MAITADRLLAGVKRRILIPGSQTTFQNSDILATIDDIISSRIVPMIESVNQEFFVTSHEEELVAGQSEYSIPYRAVGRALRELKIKDNNDNTRNIALVNLEDSQYYSGASLTVGFYFKGDKIRLIPDVPDNISPDQSLEMFYRLAPNALCTASDAALVTGVSSTTVTVSSVPSNIVTGVSVDFIQGKSGNTIYAIDKTVSNVSGTTLTFAADTIPDDLAAGDWISYAGTSPVVNFVPNECQRLIETMSAYSILNSLGDFEGAKILAEDMSIEEKNMLKILEPRIDGEPTVIINRSSLVRGNKFSQRTWLYGT